MSNSKLSLLYSGVKAAAIKHTPEILTGVGIAGFFTGTILAVKSTPKALILIENKEKEIERPLNKIEVVKTTWKCYIPTIICTTLSTACIVGASKVHLRRNAALAAAYSLSETAFKEYKEEVVNTVGAKKEKEIKDAIDRDNVKNRSTINQEVILTGYGQHLCLDALSGRLFRSDIETVRKVINDLNARLMNEMWISLNEYYYEIGLPPIEIGDDLGWDSTKSMLDMEYSSQLTENNVPCLVINFSVGPRYDYRRDSW